MKLGWAKSLLKTAALVTAGVAAVGVLFAVAPFVGLTLGMTLGMLGSFHAIGKLVQNPFAMRDAYRKKVNSRHARGSSPAQAKQWAERAHVMEEAYLQRAIQTNPTPQKAKGYLSEQANLMFAGRTVSRTPQPASGNAPQAPANKAPAGPAA